MSYEDSPSLDDYQGGIPEAAPDPEAGRQRVRVLLGLLAGLSILIWLVVLLGGDARATLSGRGIVEGTVVDNFNRPLAAEIILLGGQEETTSDSAGRFLLRDVPAGEQTIVVAKDGTGLPYRVSVPRGGRVDMGALILVSTPAPGS